jgi:hypothetical protein
MSSRLARIFLFCAFLVGLLFVLEVGVRVSGLVDHLYTEPAFEASPSGTYWRYRPHFEGMVLGPTAVRIGPFGSRLHGAEEAVTGQKIVAIFGDSITFGQGVEAHLTFAAALERWLGDTALPVKVMNFGVAGHTLEMELDHLADRLNVIDPALVILAFHSDDLSPKRADNRVDQFGYLTKKIFGPPSFWMDWLRALLRRSHLALLAKDGILRLQKFRSTSSQEPPPDAVDELLKPFLDRFRSSMKRFDGLTRAVKRIVVCVDLQDNPLTDGIHRVMQAEFAAMAYVHGPDGFRQLPNADLLVPRDGHPNALAHKTYAELLWPLVRAAAQGNAVTAARISSN